MARWRPRSQEREELDEKDDEQDDEKDTEREPGATGPAAPPEADEGSVLPLPQVRAVLEALVFASPEWAPKVRELVRDIARPIAVVETDPDAEALPGERAEGERAPGLRGDEKAGPGARGGLSLDQLRDGRRGAA